MLSNESKECHHCETTVFNLLELQRFDVTLGKTSRVKNTAGISWDIAIWELVGGKDGILVGTAGLLVILEPADFHPSHQKELNGQKSLGIGEVLFGASGKPVMASDFCSQDASNAKHSPAGMLQLSLYIPLERFRVGTQTQGVESKVSWEVGGSEVRRDIGTGEPIAGNCPNGARHAASGLQASVKHKSDMQKSKKRQLLDQFRDKNPTLSPALALLWPI